MRRVISIGIVAACTVLLIALLMFLRKPAFDAGEAGMFANDCCGTVKLADGKMLLMISGRYPTLSLEMQMGHTSCLASMSAL